MHPNQNSKRTPSLDRHSRTAGLKVTFTVCVHYTNILRVLTLSGLGFFDYVKDWGWADCALWRFEASGDFIFCPNQSNMVSNDTLGLYLPAETLKPFLCCILSP